MKKLLASLVALAAMVISHPLHAAPGDIYEADAASGKIFKFTPSGTKTTLASGLDYPLGLTFDAVGNIFFSEIFAGTISKITPAGVKTVMASGLSEPHSLAFDGTGNLYVGEFNAGRISKITPAGVNTVFASIKTPRGLAFDALGNLFVADDTDHLIVKITPQAGRTVFTSNVASPRDIAFDSTGNLFVLDTNDSSSTLYKFTSSASRSTFATLPANCYGITYDSLSGDFYIAVGTNSQIIRVDKNGAQSTFASNLDGAYALAIEPVIPAPGIVYVADGGGINVVNSTGRRSTFTANGLLGQAYPLAFDSKGNLFAGQSTGVIKITPAAKQSNYATSTSALTALAIDSADSLFYGDTKTVYKVSHNGTKTTFGTTTDEILGMAVDASDNLFVSTFSSSNVGSIIKFTSAGAQSVFATGIGKAYGLAFSASGDLYAAQYGSTILKFTPSGTKSTYSSHVGLLLYLAFDAAGNLYVSESGSVFKYAPNGFGITFYSGNAIGIAVEKPTGRPLNIATRLKVQTGDNVLIAGFIITGTESKRVLIRGIGPSLTNFGVPGALQDPTLELYAGATKVIANDNWKINDATGNSQQAGIESTGIPPTNDLESAIEITLSPGAYTALLRGKNNTAGVGSVELYDLSQTFTFSNVANISTRGFVDTGDNAMIGGFIIAGGDGYGKVIVRAIGPSLAALGVANSLADPTLELHNSSGTLIDQNDDWKIGNQAAIQATGVAPGNDRESAILTTLPAGSYTAVVKGYNGGTGVGLVEVYNLK